MAQKSLEGKTIWIARPAGQAEDITKRIEQAGGQAFVMPVMDIIPCEASPKDIQQVQNLDHFQQVIFLSTNAVKYGLELLAHYWPQWPVGIQWWAVGQVTADAIKSYGINAQTPNRQFSSEGLIEAIGVNQLLDQKMLIVRGVNGRNLLPDTLQAKGAKITLLEVYKRQVANPGEEQRQKLVNFIKNDQLSAMLVTSVEALENAGSIAADHKLPIKNIPLVVISERIADAAVKLGFEYVHVAQGMESNEIMKLLFLKFPNNSIM